MFKFLFSLLAVCSTAVLFASPKPNIAQWVEQLGDRNYHTREKAFLALDVLGTEALPDLKQAMKSNNLEQVARAERLYDRISFREKNAKAISPTLVSLDVKDTRLEDIFALLQKQTGYTHLIPVNRTILTQRFTVKVATETPYWQAILKICDVAKLEVVQSVKAQFASPTHPSGSHSGGSVVFRVKPRDSQSVYTSSGAYLIYTESHDADVLKICSPRHLIAPVNVIAEPNVNVQLPGYIRVLAATDIQNRNLIPEIDPEIHDRMTQIDLKQHWPDSLNKQNEILPPVRPIISLRADTSPSQIVVKSLTAEGRVAIWGKVMELDSVEGLDQPQKNAAKQHATEFRLKASVTPTQSDRSIYRLEVMMTIPLDNTIQLAVHEDPIEEVWFGQTVDGKLAPLPRKPAIVRAKTPWGLNLFDSQGRRFDLNVHSAERTQVTLESNREYEGYSIVFVAHPTEKNCTKPVRLALRGSRGEEVRVPFVLNHFPVQTGTRPAVK